VLQEDSNGNTTSEPMRLEPIDESQLPFWLGDKGANYENRKNLLKFVDI
jgi:hypothetical protein